jgi:hypothetical protein
VEIRTLREDELEQAWEPMLDRAGRLSGGTPEERGALDAAFAGPVPWMLDEF